MRLNSLVRPLALMATLVVAACAAPPSAGPARPMDHPAVIALRAAPVPDYAADVSLARKIAGACPRYVFDDALARIVDAERETQGRGGAIAILRQRDAVDAMTDIRLRTFQARYGTVPGMSDVCEPADAELKRGAAVSALLVPVKGL